MYALCAMLLASGFALSAVLLPVYWNALYSRLQDAIAWIVERSANSAIFSDDESTTRQAFHWVRLWFFVAAGLFALIGISDGYVIRNHVDSVFKVAAYGVAALGLSAFFIISAVAYRRLIPGLRSEATLRCCGLRAVGVLDRQKRNRRRFLELLERRIVETDHVRILDVSGYAFFVKEVGSKIGLLRKVLAQRPDVPVSVLLLNPIGHEMDPDHRHLTVYQSVLAELGIQSGTYVKLVQQTLDLIARINERRSREGQVEVRFYDEKPTMRALIFADSSVVLPWQPPGNERVPYLEVSRESAMSSLYETFRRDFARLWTHGVTQVLAPATARR